LRTLEDLVAAIADLKRRKPAITRVVAKLNEGVSGDGNATIDIGNATAPMEIRTRVDAMRFESSSMTIDRYLAKLAEHGGIVEELIAGRDFRSPSAQLRITPLGELEPLSTHDQLLGGPSGQAYLGCRFPADREYGPAIMHEAQKVGRRLVKEGVLGRFALDFVAVRGDQGAWEVYAIEINLRKGGTTHPFLTLQFLTDGTFNPESGAFTTPRGEQKCFVASDHVDSPAYRVFTHSDLFDIAARHRLHFDQSRQTGIVFHMVNGVGEQGSLGLTAVGNTHEEADDFYKRTVAALDMEARG